LFFYHFSYFERYIDGSGHLIITCESGGVKATRKYKRATE
jgi:hypothetical protein